MTNSPSNRLVRRLVSPLVSKLVSVSDQSLYSKAISQPMSHPSRSTVRLNESRDRVQSRSRKTPRTSSLSVPEMELITWIGNNTNDITPWEAVVDKMYKNLKRWKKMHPTMKGRKAIIQIIVGGYTQFLTKAQGMPTHIESALTKIIRDFMWEDDSSPRITLKLLQKPIDEGGLNLLDIKARNEAIEIVWLKAYLNFSPTCPT